MEYLLVFIACFLLGSIPWGVIISRVFFHTDVREHGSGNIGTTNSIRAMGKVGGYAVFLLDFGKGILSGLIASWVFAASGSTDAATLHMLQALSFAGCIWGHIFSPWLKFKGGKGIAVAVGCLFTAYNPLVAVIELIVFAVLVVATKYVSVGSIAAAAINPFFAFWVFWGDWPAAVLASAAALTIVWAHRENIARLRAGTESRIGKK